MTSVHAMDQGVVRHQAWAIDSRGVMSRGGVGQGTVITNVWSGFVASRSVTVSSTVGSQIAAVTTEWIVAVAALVKSTPWMGGRGGTGLGSTVHGGGEKLGTEVVWCMVRHRAAVAVLRWRRLVQNWERLAMKTVVADGSKRVASEKASAEGTMMSGVTHKRGFWDGNEMAMDGMPGSMDSQVVYRLDRGWELRLEGAAVVDPAVRR